VLVASRPGEAIKIAREHDETIHLVLTDVVMPEMNGRELFRNIHSFRPQARALFMSGYTDDVIGQHGILEDGVHFISKPFSIHDLSLKIREVLEGAGHRTGPPLAHYSRPARVPNPLPRTTANSEYCIFSSVKSRA